MSQESSPITQWQTRLRHTLKLVPESQRELAKDELTSSTIELALSIIGEDEPEGEYVEHNAHSMRPYVRNALRAELRQSLKEMKSE